MIWLYHEVLLSIQYRCVFIPYIHLHTYLVVELQCLQVQFVSPERQSLVVLDRRHQQVDGCYCRCECKPCVRLVMALMVG